MPRGFDASMLRCFVLVDEEGGVAFPEVARGLRGDPARAALSGLAGALLRRTVDWARELTGVEPEVFEVPRDSARLAELDGPVLMVRPALVRLAPEQAEDLIDDLSSGCDVVVGPTLAGGWYLLALAAADSELLAAVGDGAPGTAGRLLAAASGKERMEVGLLRAERDLVSDSDLRAAAADPLVDREVAGLLRAVLDAS